MEGIDCGKGHGKWTKDLWKVQTVEKDMESGQKNYGMSRLWKRTQNLDKRSMEGLDCGTGQGKWTKDLWKVQTVEQDMESGQKIYGRSRLEKKSESGQYQLFKMIQ